MTFSYTVTLIEVLPKEKKQKEEKIQTFGQTTIDLLDLIKGHTEMSQKLTVYPTPGSTLEAQPSESQLVSGRDKLLSVLAQFKTIFVSSNSLSPSWT
jgi:hypothetical protein